MMLIKHNINTFYDIIQHYIAQNEFCIEKEVIVKMKFVKLFKIKEQYSNIKIKIGHKTINRIPFKYTYIMV